MNDWSLLAEQLTPEVMRQAHHAVQTLYEELFPDLQLVVLSVEKNGDKNEQIDRMIRILESMR